MYVYVFVFISVCGVHACASIQVEVRGKFCVLNFLLLALCRFEGLHWEWCESTALSLCRVEQYVLSVYLHRVTYDSINVNPLTQNHTEDTVRVTDHWELELCFIWFHVTITEPGWDYIYFSFPFPLLLKDLWPCC